MTEHRIRSLDQRQRDASSQHLHLAAQESLYRRLIARDERALVELIDLATPWLLGVAENILHDGTEAEEVVLDAFRRLWHRVGDITDTRSGIMPWMLRVTRNLAIDRLRSRKRQAHGDALIAAGYAHDIGLSADATFEMSLDGRAVHDAVHHALSELSTDQERAVRLAFFAGLSHSEIAATLGIPLGTVKGRLRLAFEHLRGSLSAVREWAL